MHHGLTFAQSVALVGAVIALLGVLIAGFNVWMAASNERKRGQPMVIAHEEHGRTFSSDPGHFAVGGYITNEASGHAFNVRFGVEMGGARYPQKHAVGDPDSGTFIAFCVPASGDQPSAPGRSWFRSCHSSAASAATLTPGVCIGRATRTPGARPGRRATRGIGRRDSTSGASAGFACASGESSGFATKPASGVRNGSGKRLPSSVKG
jgi:hypothetical protein